jgi:hypothetical protein
VKKYVEDACRGGIPRRIMSGWSKTGGSFGFVKKLFGIEDGERE